MEFELSFDPVEHNSNEFRSGQLGSLVDVYTPGNFPNLSEADVVVFSITENRGLNSDEKLKFEAIRNELYSLYQGENRIRIADLGTLKLGASPSDTYQLLADVLQECNDRGLFALFVGGSQDCTVGQYKSFVQSNQFCNMVAIDSRFDLGLDQQNLNANSYLSHIINLQPNVLFNYSNLAYQSYLVSRNEIEFLNKLFFDVHRLGSLRSNLEEVEPVLRDANFISLDLSAVKMSECPAVVDGSPNGLTSDEVCQLMRYSALGNKLQSFAIYNFNGDNDINNQSAKLIAQMIWCFFEGFFHKLRAVTANDENLVKYHVSMRDGEYNTCFFKNKQNDKWWMEIPILSDENQKFAPHFFVPCSYSDYLVASKGDIPERWWQAFQKIN
jgi:arginase family enzyme